MHAENVMKTRGWIRARALAAAMGAALLAAGLLMPAAARAAPSDLPDTRTQASLTVHKYLLPDGVDPGPAAGGSSRSQASVPEQATPLADIAFTLRRAYSQGEADALVSQGAAKAEDFSDVPGHRGYLLRAGDEEMSQKTAANGSARFDLTGKLGTYLVTEQPDPRVEVRAKPFLASVPMTDPADSSKWLYSVHVYPKNYQLDIDKCIVKGSEDVMASSNATGYGNYFRIDADIPEDVGTYASYVVTDALDWRLNIKSNLNDIYVKVGKDNLRRDEDYTVTVTDTTDAQGHACQLVTWDFSKGLSKLQSAVRGGKGAGEARVSISFCARLTDDAVNGTLDNGAELTVVNAQGASHTVRSGRPTISYAAVRVTKNAAESRSLPLAGAKFRIANSLENAKAGRWMGHWDGNGAQTPVWEVTTDDKGVATFGGLAFDLESGTDYWLVEVAPPDGYLPMMEPVKVHVGPGASGDGADTLMSRVQVLNARVTELPATGGTGTALPVAGAAVVAVGIAVAVGSAVRATRRGR